MCRLQSDKRRTIYSKTKRTSEKPKSVFALIFCILSEPTRAAAAGEAAASAREAASAAGKSSAAGEPAAVIAAVKTTAIEAAASAAVPMPA